MSNNAEQTVAALQKKNLESAMKLAQLSIENSQRILQLQMQTAKDLFEDGVANVQSLTQIKTPNEAMELRARYAQQAAEKMFSTSRTIAEITAELQHEMSKLVSEQLTSGSQEMIEAMQGFLKGMPLNSHAAAEAMQSTFEAARKTLEQVAKASSDAFSAVAQTEKKSRK
ncbi:phasin family protein [Uliginosibacterium sediminicola]|uniref:Phasin family protein n=1 Tax=Uliginosibacterium sediminicola TaxID=2024550 RepID=A0ABU9Z143_9RHOO